VFIDYAKQLGFEKIATGHYAMISKKNSLYSLKTPRDKRKDQTYFLHTLNQEQLSKVIFPLADIEKPEVIKLAKQNNFKSYNKKESMGICFIGNKKFKNFISKYIDDNPGDILNEKNEVIVLDELHTPDSSRYWIKEGYEERIASGKEPQNIDKEFLRLWFKNNCNPYEDEILPEAPKELVVELSLRYIYLYERITGQFFDFSLGKNINKRMSENLNIYLNSN